MDQTMFKESGANVISKGPDPLSRGSSSSGRVSGTGIVGVDPGQSGGFGAIYPDGTVVGIPMPQTPRGITDVLRDLRNSGITAAFIERTVKYAGKNMPQSSAIVYGKNCGVLEASLILLKFTIEKPTPQQWQKAFTMVRKPGEDQTKWKNRLKDRAEDLFPSAKPTHKTADALLLAEFGRRWMAGQIITTISSEDE